MMFAKNTQQMKKIGADRYALAESKLNASVRFSVSQIFLFFVKED